MTRTSLAAGLLGVALCAGGPLASSQVLGEQAEMDRLEARAEELIASGDADGAATSIGKAALMAAQLAKGGPDPHRSAFFRGAEALFRAQEHAYRALALYQRAGGRPPASSGVCGTLNLAKIRLREAEPLLVEAARSSPPGPSRTGEAPRLQQAAAAWAGTLEGLGADFQCP